MAVWKLYAVTKFNDLCNEFLDDISQLTSKDKAQRHVEYSKLGIHTHGVIGWLMIYVYEMHMH